MGKITAYFDTIAEFCLYDETHNDYVYQDAWVDFLVHFLQAKVLTDSELRTMARKNETLNVDDYRIQHT